MVCVLILLMINIPILSAQQNNTNDTLRLSLKETWERAEKFSRVIAIKNKAVSISNEEIKDSKMERLPELGIMGSAEKATNIPIYENGLFSRPTQHEVIHTLYKVGTDFALNIYNGNKLNLKIEEQGILHKIASLKKDQKTSDIHYQTASFYLDLQRSFIFQTLIVKDIADQEKQLAEVKAFYKNGTVLKSDVLRIELELSKRKMTLVQIQNDILIANQKLNIIIGEPDDRLIKPIETLSTTDEKSYDDFLKEALEYSFPYQISEKKTVISEIGVKKVNANLRPKISMYGEFYYANPQIFLYPYNPYWYSLGIAGVKISFPISATYHNVHKVRAAKLELEQEEIAHKDQQDMVRQQVKEAYLRYREALIQIGVAKIDVVHAVENARIIKNTYFNHTTLVTDLLDADILVLRSRFELEGAKIVAQNKYYLLKNITGVL
ncbi:TolC family protein [Pedobacter changchengzhani]|uniref:TolC family protein n=2 Tax=Pedobacter changchengzhani TaxID=2529274 RepID=A0A4R5MMY4_9SPHI|nr:TolC family protein [Pedobacter changchengzhani]